MSAVAHDVLVEADGCAIGFGRHPVASGISLTLRRGEIWGIAGPNGAGKTTLVRTLMGILPPLGGRVHRAPGLRFGYVKQRDALHDLYPFTAAEVVMTGRHGALGAVRRPGPRDRERVEHALARTGILDLRDRAVRELSGGQKQRVLIARALCAEPDVIVLDEPTNDMDLVGEESVLGLIREVHAETGAAVVMISHLLHAVLRIAERIFFIDRDRTGAFSKEEFVEQNHLERFYGVPIRITRHPDGTYGVSAAASGAREGGGDAS